jgi:hypothetical protein
MSAPERHRFFDVRVRGFRDRDANALQVRARDGFGQQQLAAVTLTFTPQGDTQPPVITAALATDTAPAGATNSDGVMSDPTFTGRVTDASPVTSFRAGLDATTPADFTNVLADLAANGQLDAALAPSPLADGPHQVLVTAYDRAGNAAQAPAAFTVTAGAFHTGPAASTGWGANGPGLVRLAERDSFVVQTTVPVPLGQAAGTRTVRFEVAPRFDGTDTAASKDRLAVYLVDPANPAQTLLDGGRPGSPVFALAEGQAEYPAGLVRFDGRFVELDVTSLAAQSSGLLVVQLINGDGDTGSAVDVRNTGSALGRKVVAVFPGLPTGVSLLNAVGTDAAGNPYVNFESAIAAGGLAAGATSQAVEVTFDNPGLLRFALRPTVLAGPPNRAGADRHRRGRWGRRRRSRRPRPDRTVRRVRQPHHRHAGPRQHDQQPLRQRLGRRRPAGAGRQPQRFGPPHRRRRQPAPV